MSCDDCGRTSEELADEGIELLSDITICDEHYDFICQECCDVLRDELEPKDYDQPHPNETIEEFWEHEDPFK